METVECSVCHKTYDRAKSLRTPKCEGCHIKERQEAKLREFRETVESAQEVIKEHIPSELLEKTYKNFNRALQPKAYNAILKWRSDKKWTSKGFLMLSPGVYGVGKTHLAMAFLNQYILEENNLAIFDEYQNVSLLRFPMFMPEPLLLARIRNTYNKSTEETEEDVYDDLLNSSLLIIDDVGKQKPKDYSFLQSVYYRVIDAIDTHKDRHLLFTTNLTTKELEAHLGGATTDRLVGMCGENIIKMTGESYRTKVKK